LFDDDVRVERIVPTNTGAAGPKYSIVTSQPAIKGVPAPEHEIEGMMVGKGFEKIAPGGYYNKDSHLAVYDMKGEGHEQANVLKTADGRIHPIDPIIQRMNPEMAKDFAKSPAAMMGTTAKTNAGELQAASGKSSTVDLQVSAALADTISPLVKYLKKGLAITDPDAQLEYFKRAIEKWPELTAPLQHDSAVADALTPELVKSFVAGLHAKPPTEKSQPTTEK